MKCDDIEVFYNATVGIGKIMSTRIVHTSKEPVCPRVELILKIIIIFIKSKPC